MPDDLFTASILSGIAKGLNQGLQQRRQNEFKKQQLQQADERLRIQEEGLLQQGKLKEVDLLIRELKVRSGSEDRATQNKLKELEAINQRKFKAAEGERNRRARAELAAITERGKDIRAAKQIKAKVARGEDVTRKVKTGKELAKDMDDTRTVIANLEKKVRQNPKDLKNQAKLASAKTLLSDLASERDLLRKGVGVPAAKAVAPRSLLDQLKGATRAEANAIRSAAKPLWDNFSADEKKEFNRLYGVSK